MNLTYTYTLSNNSIIEPTGNVKDLGIFVDSKLEWDIHISNTCKKARRMSGWTLNTFRTRARGPMLTIYKSLIRPILEYNSEVWNPYKKKYIIQIENIQRSFTYKIFGMQELNYWDRLKDLQIKSLQRRRELSIITNIWKIKNNIYPNSINLQFKPNNRSHGIKAILPPLPQPSGSIQSKFEQSFAVKGAKLWNSLPASLTIITKLTEFKICLKKFASGIPDRPPLPGYSGESSNSLIDLHQIH